MPADPPRPLPPPGGLAATSLVQVATASFKQTNAASLVQTNDWDDALAWEMAAFPAQDDPTDRYLDAADLDAAFAEDLDPAWVDDWPPDGNHDRPAGNNPGQPTQNNHDHPGQPAHNNHDHPGQPAHNNHDQPGQPAHNNHDQPPDGHPGQPAHNNHDQPGQPAHNNHDQPPDANDTAIQAGFRQGGTADTMPPGPELASLVDRVWQAGVDRLDDDERIGFLQAAHRLAGWAAAMRLSAIGEHHTRRVAEARASGDWRPAEHVNDEVAIALTLTKRGADRVLSLAVALGRLPLTRAALTSGAIDERRAEVIADELSGLDDEHAAAVEALLIRKAPGQTSGGLWAAARRAVIAADPSAARRRKARALKDARVAAFAESSGTAALAGRDLPPAEVLAADRHLTALAIDMRKAGAEGTMDELRARAYLHLLAGQPAETLSGVAAGDPRATQPRAASPPGTGQSPSGPPLPALRGSVHLTMPLATWLGWSEQPGEVAGFGPLDAADSLRIAELLASKPANRWCISLTDQAGRPIAHGCARASPAAGPQHEDRRRARGNHRGAWRWIQRMKITPLETRDCTHPREGRSYQPGPRLRHLSQIRNATCIAPGCRRSATRCDLDHTIPYHAGGRTCECNLGPLCRRDHQCKQLPGWSLAQPSPGSFTWVTPSGRSYPVHPTEYST